MFNTIYDNDFESHTRSELEEFLALIRLLEEELRELATVACRPTTVVLQKPAYGVYATTWGKSGKYTGGYV